MHTWMCHFIRHKSDKLQPIGYNSGGLQWHPRLDMSHIRMHVYNAKENTSEHWYTYVPTNQCCKHGASFWYFDWLKPWRISVLWISVGIINFICNSVVSKSHSVFCLGLGTREKFAFLARVIANFSLKSVGFSTKTPACSFTNRSHALPTLRHDVMWHVMILLLDVNSISLMLANEHLVLQVMKMNHEWFKL